MRGAIATVSIAVLSIFCVAWKCAAQQIKFTPLERSEVVHRAETTPATDQERAAQLKTWFDQAGCGVIDLTEQKVAGAAAPNVICRLPGKSSSTIVIGAHFDHASSGQRPLDNWSGAALLPGLYRCLKDRKRHFNFIFVAFADNGNDLLGSKSFADHLEEQGAHNVRAMINLDTLGLSPTKIWTAHSDKELVKTLIQCVYMLKLPASQVDITATGNSDSDPFAERSLPQITVHSITQEHLRKAVPTKFRPGNYYDSYRLLCGYLALLDATLKQGSRS
jgi:Peptidase family M28